MDIFGRGVLPQGFTLRGWINKLQNSRMLAFYSKVNVRKSNEMQQPRNLH